MYKGHFHGKNTKYQKFNQALEHLFGCLFLLKNVPPFAKELASLLAALRTTEEHSSYVTPILYISHLAKV